MNIETEWRYSLAGLGRVNSGTVKFFALIDGACIENLPEELEESGFDYCCLYRGELDDNLRQAAPYLVELDDENGGINYASQWLGKSGMVLVEVGGNGSLSALRGHFRRLNMVTGPRGESLLFRYYDPRVLRVFLPMCEPDQLQDLFADLVVAYICESKTPGRVLRYEFKERNLTTVELAL